MSTHLGHRCYEPEAQVNELWVRGTTTRIANASTKFETAFEGLEEVAETVSAGASEIDPVCAEDAWEIGTDKKGAQGALLLNGAVEYVHGSRCRVEAIAVTRRTNGEGALLKVDTNPISQHLESRITGPRAEDAVDIQPAIVAWRKWCDGNVADYV